MNEENERREVRLLTVITCACIVPSLLVLTIVGILIIKELLS
ncbi:hypothetical protein [Amycolatopsis dendrobii]|nr:hypothetical protein [Amycolatopsis dendrobii]